MLGGWGGVRLRVGMWLRGGGHREGWGGGRSFEVRGGGAYYMRLSIDGWARLLGLREQCHDRRLLRGVGWQRLVAAGTQNGLCSAGLQHYGRPSNLVGSIRRVIGNLKGMIHSRITGLVQYFLVSCVVRSPTSSLSLQHDRRHILSLGCLLAYDLDQSRALRSDIFHAFGF